MNQMHKEPWHLSKSVPITLIVAILMQTASIAWFVSSMNSNIEANARQITKNEILIEDIRQTDIEQAVQLGRIEQSIQDLHLTLERIARELERPRNQ